MVTRITNQCGRPPAHLQHPAAMLTPSNLQTLCFLPGHLLRPWLPPPPMMWSNSDYTHHRHIPPNKT